MRWPCVPSKNSVSKLVSSPEPVVPIASAEPVASAEPLANKPPCCKASKPCCACAPTQSCCLPISYFRCCKASQPLVLRSTPPAESEKLTAAEVSVPDDQPKEASVAAAE